MTALANVKREHPELWEQVGESFHKRPSSEYDEGVYDGHLKAIAKVAGLPTATVHFEAVEDFGGGCG